MSAKTRKIEHAVLAVLSAGRCEADRYHLPTGQLDRPMYEAVNKVLAALGGKWNRSAKAHVFGEECEPIIEAAIETGEYTRPSDMGWFPTPAAIAAQAASLADIEPGHVVLEPSAGEGALVATILAAGGAAECVEIDERRAEALRAKHEVPVSVLDFLSVEPTPTFDRVLMNPPFAKRADIHHVLHARKFLKPGGMLVSIMSAGVAFREDALTRDFRDQCETITELPDGAFLESGTGVRTVVVTMRAVA